MSFDKDEKLISDALDALDREIAAPDLLLGIRAKLDGGADSTASDGAAKFSRRRKPVRFFVVLAAVIAVLGITALAASLGGFDWLIEKAKPAFGDAVGATEQSTESQGIKVTLAATGNSGNMAMLYLTVQDTEGLGRITADTQVSLAGNPQGPRNAADLIYFDQKTGIAAYEVRLGAPGNFDGQPFTLEIDGMLYGKTDLGQVRVPIDLAQAAADGEHIDGPSPGPDQIPTEFLTPGHVIDIPGTKSAFVSAIGISHGGLEVQYVQPNVINWEFLPNKIQPYLLDADGNRIDLKQNETGYWADAQLHQLQELPQMQKSAYLLQQAYFDVDTDHLDGYTLCFEGSVWSAVAGDWILNVDLGSTQPVREAASDLTFNDVMVLGVVKDVQMNDVAVTVNPFGMTLTGSGMQDSDWCVPQFYDAVLETTNGDISLSPISGSCPAPNGPFELIWHASSAIDMSSVIAVRIGDNRIVLNAAE